MSIRAGGRSVGFSDFAPYEKRQSLKFTNSLATIDLRDGAYCEITLNSDVESLLILHWLPSPIVNRISLEIINPGFYRIDLSLAKWNGGGTPPRITPNGVDLIELMSHKGGQPGSIIGRMWANIR